MPALYNTRGIVFHHVKYGETSIIARIYTEKFGLQSYMIKGVRSKRARMPYTLFQPGTLLEIVVYKTEKHTLQHLREARCEHPYESALRNIRKSVILLFLIDILNKTIREEESSQDLFDFIHHSLMNLDQTPGPVANYHLVFLIHLARFLGFSPRDNYSDYCPYFNLTEGEFYPDKKNPGLYMDPPLSKVFSSLLHIDYAHMFLLTFSPDSRNDLLDKILEYYRIHSPFIRDIKSHLILREVFS